MLGAIVGDIIGPHYEYFNDRRYDFELFTEGSCFTDDTVMTLAIARWLMESNSFSSSDLTESMVELGRKYPDVGYGPGFKNWIWTDNGATV